MENSFSGEWPEKGHGGGGSASVSFPWSFPSSCDYSSAAAAAAAAFLSWPAQPFGEVAEDRALSASKSHSEAEKRRRDRINAQLATLRKLIPKSEKMDKAALLSSVVDHVKDLKRRATEITKVLDDVPTDTDEVTIDQHSTNDAAAAAINDDQASGGSSSSTSPNYLKASVCCDDRPELFSDINRALKDHRLTTVHADVTSLGGRVKSVFVLQLCPDKDAATSNNMNSVKQSLKVALCKIAIPSSTTSYRIKSKRQRFFLPAHYH